MGERYECPQCGKKDLKSELDCPACKEVGLDVKSEPVPVLKEAEPVHEELERLEEVYNALADMDHDSAMRVIEWVRGTLVRKSIARISEHPIGKGRRGFPDD